MVPSPPEADEERPRSCCNELARRASEWREESIQNIYK
jgi:hypothetical protein